MSNSDNVLTLYQAHDNVMLYVLSKENKLSWFVGPIPSFNDVNSFLNQYKDYVDITNPGCKLLAVTSFDVPQDKVMFPYLKLLKPVFNVDTSAFADKVVYAF